MPQQLDYLFVMTYGRSGSTLLQGVLNSIPGYLIRGENRQVLRHLHLFHDEAMRERRLQRRRNRRHDRSEGTTATHPFFGIDGYPPRRSLARTRRLALDTLLRPEADTRVVGFKEIRWEGEDLHEYVAWLREVFPGARFVVNTRDLDDVSRSKWWADRPDARAHLEQVENRILAVADGLGEAAYRVHYDAYVADHDALRPLFAWLGETYDPGRVAQVLDQPHSY